MFEKVQQGYGREIEAVTPISEAEAKELLRPYTSDTTRMVRLLKLDRPMAVARCGETIGVRWNPKDEGSRK